MQMIPVRLTHSAIIQAKIYTMNAKQMRTYYAMPLFDALYPNPNPKSHA